MQRRGETWKDCLWKNHFGKNGPSQKKQQHGTKSHNVPSIPMEAKFASGESQTSLMFLCKKNRVPRHWGIATAAKRPGHWDHFRHNIR